MTTRSEADDSTALTTFNKKLKKYTKRAECGRYYVLAERLKKWLISSADETQSNGPKWVDLLLQATNRSKARSQPGAAVESHRVQEQGLKVFSILLYLDLSNLLHIFLEDDIVDDKLPIKDPASLKTTLRNASVSNSEEAATRFHEIQWQFCAPSFELDDGKNYDRDYILPISKKKVINGKGGTACLWQIEVLEDFVGKSLRQEVSRSNYDRKDLELGTVKCYHFALKSFESVNKDLFNNEKEIFRGLRGQSGVVKCLANYSYAKNTNRAAYNILLEYGDMDLDDYFFTNHPPFLQGEIQSFWDELFTLADVLKDIHTVKNPSNNYTFNGWHADIKPDNVLMIGDKFKLTDPGFAKFHRATSEYPMAFIEGGTWEYGAPERNKGNKVSQTIDIWSLGCVFSIAATWIIGGYGAIQQFSKLRRITIKELKQQQKSRLSVQSGECFHDGEKVLASVTSWHQFMRSSLRQPDNITGQVLDLIDRRLLLEDPRQRCDAKSLSDELTGITGRSKAGAPSDPRPDIMELLLKFDEEVTSKPVEARSGPSAPSPSGSSGTAEDRKTRKSMTSDTPPKKTARRSKYLRSALGKPDAPPKCEAQFPDTGIEEIPTLPDRGHPSSESKARLSSHESFEAVRDHGLPANSRNSQYLPYTPNHILSHQGHSSKPRDIFQARQDIEEQRKKNRTSFKLFKPPKDKTLSRYFDNRDVKFLVDNAITMDIFWAHASYVLETLVMLTTGIDENGVDLYFTIGSEKVESSKKPSEFLKAMRKAKPKPGDKTDMESRLGKILHKHITYLKSFGSDKKDLTVIILTDGMWEGMLNKRRLEDTITGFIKQSKDFNSIRKRSVSIQFVQFGKDPDATRRLQFLDDDLKNTRGIEDIVDTESAYGDADKMILGSFIEDYDHPELANFPP